MEDRRSEKGGDESITGTFGEFLVEDDAINSNAHIQDPTILQVTNDTCSTADIDVDNSQEQLSDQDTADDKTRVESDILGWNSDDDSVDRVASIPLPDDPCCDKENVTPVEARVIFDSNKLQDALDCDGDGAKGNETVQVAEIDGLGDLGAGLL